MVSENLDESVHIVYIQYIQILSHTQKCVLLYSTCLQYYREVFKELQITKGIFGYNMQAYLEIRIYLSPENMEVVGRCGHIDNLPVYLLSLSAYISIRFGYDVWVVITHLISHGTCIFLVSTCVLHNNSKPDKFLSLRHVTDV